MKKQAFTLIELIAVLVILAILALIVTPLVMNIIRKAKDAANKRSIDAYGRSIELAIATYLLDEGKFPTSIEQLTIEYSGDEVVCETTQLNTDSSVYLSGCRVAGRSMGDYTYGEDKTTLAPTYTAYEVGDQVIYNNISYYVIKASGAKESTVTLLKAEPLNAEEITTYSEGTGAKTNGNGGMEYHSNSSAYEGSYVKITVDKWKTANAPAATEARLIQYNEFENLGYVEGQATPSDIGLIKTANTPTWVYAPNNECWYWTMSPVNDSSSNVWRVRSDGSIGRYSVNLSSAGYGYGVVRPVIVLNKKFIED